MKGFVVLRQKVYKYVTEDGYIDEKTKRTKE